MSRQFAVFIAFGLCVFNMVACGSSSPAAPSSQASASSSATFTLNGQVTASTGGGISGATVRIVDGPNGGRSTTSDSNGSFTLSSLTQSGFTVSVSATNYSTASYGITLTSNQTLSASLVPLFANMLGAWNGTITSVALGASTSCTMSWLITSQVSGAFSGTFQMQGGTGCSEAGNISGTITTSNSITSLGAAAISVGNGAVCSDSGITTSGLLSGRVATIQKTFTRTCTSPVFAIFAESQTISMSH